MSNLKIINEIDKKILNFLQKEGRISNAELARRLNMAPSGILERVRKLEKKNIIQAYETRLDSKKLGLVLTVFIQIKSNEGVGQTHVGQQLAGLQEIQEVFFTAGEYSYLLKAKVADTDALTNLLRKLGEIEHVRDSRTMLVLDTLKESCALNLV